MDIDSVLADVAETARDSIGVGHVADYIPGLAQVDPDQFGMAVVMNDGTTHTIGAADVRFSVQSISKVFTLGILMSRDSATIWERVGREPSGNPFNSMLHLDQEAGKPRNPFINSGALVVTDRLHKVTGDASSSLLELVREECGCVDIEGDPEIERSEREHGHRIAAMAHLLASHGNLECSVEDVLTQYFWQCSLSMNCVEIAQGGGWLSRGGVRRDGSPLLPPPLNKRLNAVMLTCGTYDAAGEFAFRVGVPAKSGVGGGILAVVPDRCTICVWSPALSTSGNSTAGVAALDRLTELTGWSIF